MNRAEVLGALRRGALAFYAGFPVPPIDDVARWRDGKVADFMACVEADEEWLDDLAARPPSAIEEEARTLLATIWSNALCKVRTKGAPS